MIKFTITNLATGEKIPLHRDARHQHPAWVHQQLTTEDEADLQAFLDQYDIEAFYDDDGNYIGADNCGVDMLKERED